MRVRDGITYEAMPGDADVDDCLAVEAVTALPGETPRQGVERLLDEIHIAAINLRAGLVWLGELVLSDDKRTMSAQVVYLR